VRDRRPLSRWLYLACLLMAVAGIGAGYLCGRLASRVGVDAAAPRLTRATLPGRAELSLPAGEYVGYLEQSRPAEPVGDLSCQLSDPSRGAVGLFDPAGRYGYQDAGRAGVPQFRFHAATTGDYVLDCAYPPATGNRRVVLAIGPDADVTVAATVLVGLGGLASALVGALVVAWQRRRMSWRPGAAANPSGRPPRLPGRRAAAGGLLLSLLGLSALSAVPATVGLARSARSDWATRGYARAALGLSAVWIVLGAVFLVVRAGPAADAVTVAEVLPPAAPPAAPGTPIEVPFRDLHVGDCIDADRGMITMVTRLSCGHPHDAEVYAMPEIGDDQWPGVDVVARRGDEACDREFTPYVGVDHMHSGLDVSLYPPSRNSWLTWNHRVICVLGQEGRKTLGTLRGARR
jgi:hypothetical protein